MLVVTLPLIVFGSLPQGVPSFFETLDGEEFSTEELSSGRWALGFIVLPNCPACEEVIDWFSYAAQAFPEIQFLLVAPEPTPELKEAIGDSYTILIDQGGIFGGWLGVERAPTVFLNVEGVYVDRLDWPFIEGFLLRKLAESLLVDVPNPRLLIGQPAPDFSATDLEGREITFTELPRPLLLAFVSLGCAPCWEVLPVLEELSQEVAVGLVAVVGSAGLSEVDQERLEQFLNDMEKLDGRAVVLFGTWVEGEGFRMVEAYKVGQSPTFILIDGKGVIAGVWEGHVEGEELLEDVRAALSDDRARDK